MALFYTKFRLSRYNFQWSKILNYDDRDVLPLTLFL